MKWWIAQINYRPSQCGLPAERVVDRVEAESGEEARKMFEARWYRNADVSNVREATDYTHPIARNGEQQFACILRNRSGMDSGEIDMGLRDIDELCAGDQQAVVDMALSIYLGYVRRTGKRGSREHEILSSREP